MSVVYCQECGFQNPESANYCSRCGALLARGESAGGDDADVLARGDRRPRARGLRPGRARRSSCARAAAGRGRASSPPGERTRIGRSPECEIFLDDVTVSRNHAVLVERDGKFTVEDQGSLNGTFVNRRRIDSGAARGGRRAADRQVPDDLHRMTSTAKQPRHLPPKRERLLRIGEVVRRLHDEFPDISISKIRYLEDEGLLTPRRTQGGYRLFSEERPRAAPARSCACSATSSCRCA